MKCKIVKLHKFSGKKASIYTIYIDDKNTTLFDIFVRENLNSSKSEILNILNRLSVIGKETGARGQFFKHWEGAPGDGLSALYDDPEKKLRLYCIRYGSGILILGGGGPKPKNIHALQEDEKLIHENGILKKMSQEITQRIKNRDITFSNSGSEFLGDLEFDDHEEDE